MFEDITRIDQLRKEYKRQASIYHPDRGGTVEAFQHIKKAYDIRMAQLLKPVDCDLCGGKGETTKHYGFTSIAKKCLKCSGSGKIKYGDRV